MEQYYPIIYIGLFILIIAGGAALKRVARQKGAQLGAERAAQKKQNQRAALKPSQVTFADVITVGLPSDQVRQYITDTKVVNPQTDGTWTARSAFSKEIPFTVGIEDHGPQTKVAVLQFLSKNDVLDGETIWSIVASKLHKEANKMGATFSYEPGDTFQVHEIGKHFLQYRR